MGEPEGKERADLESAAPTKAPRMRIEIGLAEAGIEEVVLPAKATLPIDALAVGHYVGVKPQYAEHALDVAVSNRLLGRATGAEPPLESDLLITQLTERGIIRGELAQPFFLEDPRVPGRVIALAGMGVAGHFGVPELTVLAQELCWSLGRLGKRHLATVLIGSGNGNLSIAHAIHAWLRGIRRAISGSRADERRHLLKVTFVEKEVRNIEALNAALLAECQLVREVELVYTPLSEDELTELRKRCLAKEREEFQRKWEEAPRKAAPPRKEEVVPVRITVGLERRAYQFAAITQSAAIPQRSITIDPKLIAEANEEAAGAETQAFRWNRGRLLERLLMPLEFRDLIYTDAPIVLMLDASTARIHWELLARGESDLLASREYPAAQSGDSTSFDERLFLGTSYGLTRQLRTTFAPPPEPPPPPRRTMRVLVVADPADDAPLAGAQAEGEAVATLFGKFNELYEARTGNAVQVKALIGAYEATRTEVLDQLFNHGPYDVLHFAGHCVYDPGRSGEFRLDFLKGPAPERP